MKFCTLELNLKYKTTIPNILSGHLDFIEWKSKTFTINLQELELS